MASKIALHRDKKGPARDDSSRSSQVPAFVQCVLRKNNCAAPMIERSMAASLRSGLGCRYESAAAARHEAQSSRPAANH